MTQELRKITIKGCGWDKTSIIKALPEGGALPLLKVVGEVVEARLGQTDKGEFLRLMGEFLAENLVTGARFHAHQAILPSFIADSMGAALRQSQAVSFAVEVGAQHDVTAIIGYTYTARSLMPTEPTDRMRRLMLAAGMKPALPAPDA